MLLDEDELAYLEEIEGVHEGKYGVLCKPFPKDEAELPKKLTSEERSLLEALRTMLSDKLLQSRYSRAGKIRSEQFCAYGMAKQYECLIDEICCSQ